MLQTDSFLMILIWDTQNTMKPPRRQLLAYHQAVLPFIIKETRECLAAGNV